MVVNTGLNDHLHIRKSIIEGLLSSLLKKQQNGKVTMNNAALGFYYMLSINMLLKQLSLNDPVFVYLKSKYMNAYLRQ